MAAVKDFLVDCEQQTDRTIDAIEDAMVQMDQLLKLVWCGGSDDVDAETGIPYHAPDVQALQYLDAELKVLTNKLSELQAAADHDRYVTCKG